MYRKLVQLFSRKTVAPIPAHAPLAFDNLVSLAVTPRLYAWDVRTEVQIPMTVRQMSCQSMLFVSPLGIKQGAEVELELLLKSHSRLRLRGRVKSVTAQVCGCEGELQLSTDETVRQELARYLMASRRAA